MLTRLVLACRRPIVWCTSSQQRTSSPRLRQARLSWTGSVRSLGHSSTPSSPSRQTCQRCAEAQWNLSCLCVARTLTRLPQIIQADFVERRQKSVGGEGMTQEDLLFRMTAARLMALSGGRTALDKEAWLSTAELDERRKDRIPIVPKA